MFRSHETIVYRPAWFYSTHYWCDSSHPTCALSLRSFRISHRILPKDAPRLVCSASITYILSNARLFVRYFRGNWKGQETGCRDNRGSGNQGTRRVLRLWQIIEVCQILVSTGGLLVSFQMIQADQPDERWVISRTLWSLVADGS